MLEKQFYANGQRVYEIKDDVLTYFYQDGAVKAAGGYVDGKMEGAWTFYRADGALWQTAHFLGDQKHGRWVRYARDGAVEYDRMFAHGKSVKQEV